MIAVTCAQCGKVFQTFPAWLRKGGGKFCSRKCVGIAKTGPLARAAKMHATATTRFWERVAKAGPDECWEWTAYRQKEGYGVVSWRRHLWLAHRLALALTDGDWENESLVCHTCDNPPCCNPTHLWRGTHQDNHRDMMEKGRSIIIRGEKSSNAKLTASAVTAIRNSVGRTADIAREYNISWSTTDAIRKRLAWRHIP